MKKRVDTLLVEKGLVKSRNQSADLIKRGKIKVEGTSVLKPSSLIDENAKIIIDTEETRFVSRGGIKLEHALKEFNVNPYQKICLDIGSSTGGFTDCLIQNGAKKVYAVDVGTDQFDKDLLKNPKIILFEKTDIRNLHIPEQIDLTVIDVSFISLSLVLPYAISLTNKTGDIIALIKPQFEVGKDKLPKTGVVTDPKDYEMVIQKIHSQGELLGLKFQKLTDSPIMGGSGNKEFLIHFKK